MILSEHCKTNKISIFIFFWTVSIIFTFHDLVAAAPIENERAVGADCVPVSKYTKKKKKEESFQGCC